MAIEPSQFDAIVAAVVRQLEAAGQSAQPAAPGSSSQAIPAPLSPVVQPEAVPVRSVPAGKLSAGQTGLQIDLPDPTMPEMRARPGLEKAADAEGLEALMASTTSRIGVGRAGPRYRTHAWLLFQADHAITEDALMRDVDEGLLNEMGLFSVQTNITEGKRQYLLRPDLGRQLSEDARRLVAEKCVKDPRIQVCVGDGLSAQAIESNLRQILPVLKQGCQAAGLSMGTPFFIKYCRVGVMNDIGDLLHPDVLILLIGERPGLGRADSMSIYMAYQPQSGHTDAERDVICNVFDGGGTNPLEAGAFAVQMAQKMIRLQTAGVKMKLAEQ
jgi:ethanolamine ammonia-lyase small subunit